MSETLAKILLPLGFVLGGLFVLFQSVSGSPRAYLYMGGLIGLEVIALALWNYQKHFFPLLMLVFLFAGINIPLHNAWTTARWGVLGIGAVVGFTLYVRRPVQKFTTLHLVAGFAVTAALVSASVSAYPTIALLKTASLLLVFFYAAAGARLAVVGREAKFVAGLLLGCEALTYISALCYFVFHYELYGNPNSLGVVMGVGAAPLLLWGVIVSDGTRSYKRRLFALVLCLLLLLHSYARAAIGATCVSSFLLCFGLRRYRLLMRGVALGLLAAIFTAFVSPLPDIQSKGWLDKLTSTYLFKGDRERGIFNSRETPWAKTSAAIQEHPWFGTGFGTSVTSVEARPQDISFRSVKGATREHGNSYLAIMEWTGLLGVAPFYVLVLLVGLNVVRVVRWMRRTSNPFSPAVPITAVLAGGMLHAIFEDWMFAVGYYMCLFFWTFAFVLVDVLPQEETVAVHSTGISKPQLWNATYDAFAAGQ